MDQPINAPAPFRVENTLLSLSGFGEYNREAFYAAYAPYGLDRITLHTHSDYELLAVLRGSIAIRLPDELIPLEADDLAIVSPKTVHQIDHAVSDDAAWLNLRFSFSRIRSDTHYDTFGRIAEGFRETPVTVRRKTDESLFLLARMKRAWDARRFAPLGGELHGLLLSLFDSSESRPAPRNDSDAFRLNQLSLFIDARFAEPLTTSQLAESLSISKRQVERILRREYGMTLSELLSQRRLAAAQKLLDTTDLPVQEIALRVGFHSPSSFSHAFRKQLGLSPIQYRSRPVIP